MTGRILCLHIKFIQYYWSDLHKYDMSFPDVSLFLTRASESLVQNQLFKHIYAVLPVLGDTVGRKRQELAEKARRYADVNMVDKGTVKYTLNYTHSFQNLGNIKDCTVSSVTFMLGNCMPTMKCGYKSCTHFI